MGEKFLTADPHFGNHGIIEHCDRPYNQVRHMDASLIRNINEVAKEDDDLYIAGDFSMHTKSHRGMFEEWARKIKCRKHLIMGNHDIKDPTFYTDIGFWSVHYPYFELEEFVIIHDPAGSIMDKSRIFLCGHLHTIFRTKANCINVGVDVWNYYPISLTRIRKIVEDFSTIHMINSKRQIMLPDDIIERN